jgi:3',5'-cyclic AMP phosphodiesterase CpdA
LSIVPTAAGAPIKAAAIWQQRNAITGAAVKWRPEGAEYGGAGSGTDPASVSSFSKSNMCTEPAKKAGWISPNQIYRGDITNLSPNTRYYYQVGSDAAGWSPEQSFLTPPAADDAGATMRVLITADSGMYSPDFARTPNGNSFEAQRIFGGWATTPGRPEYTVVQAIAQQAGLGPGQQPGSKGVVDAIERALEAKDAHGVWNFGDISYSRGESHQRDLWGAQFGAQVAAKAITAYSVGNHESDSPLYPDSPCNKTTNIDSGGECNVPTRRLLQMAQPSGTTSDWYSTDIGPVHLISLNSEQLLSAKSKQRAWLEADLKSVDRSKTPWLVVGLHRPILVDSNDGGDQKSATTLRNAIEPLLAKYQVDLVLAGHIHSGQRSCVGVMKGTCVGKNDDGTAKGPTIALFGQGGYQVSGCLLLTKGREEVFFFFFFLVFRARSPRRPRRRRPPQNPNQNRAPSTPYSKRRPGRSLSRTSTATARRSSRAPPSRSTPTTPPARCSIL